MKLLFLGTASALSVGKDVFQSNMVIESESGQRLLIDCGSDAKHSLHAQGYGFSDIHAVYISHLHFDHVGGLEWFGFSKRFIDLKKALLYISQDQVKSLWDNVLSGGMCTLEEEDAALTTFFQVNSIKDHFFWENYRFDLIKTTHSIANGAILPSYGLLIKGPTQTVFITTDTRFTPESLQPIYDKSDLIFHDCETSEKKSSQHAHYCELKQLNAKTRRKIWLYDYNCGHLPNALEDGFQGFVQQGQQFHF